MPEPTTEQQASNVATWETPPGQVEALQKELQEFKTIFYWVMGAIAFFIVVNLGLIAWDLNKHDAINSRIDNLQAALYEKEEIVSCFKYSKYWEYNKCFNK